MSNIQIRPDQALAEISDFSRKLQRGARQLFEIGDICRRHQLHEINLLGICQGGTLSLCYAALYPEKVDNLVTMVTPVDFHTAPDMLSHWVRHVDVDALVEAFGNIPGELLNWTFL